MDARSRVAYQHFGDVITFDTTYKILEQEQVKINYKEEKNNKNTIWCN